MQSVKAAKELIFTVPAECDGMLLGSFLHRTKNVSQRIIRNAKRENNGITADGEMIRTVDKIACGQRIKISLPAPRCEMEPGDIPLDIFYEDEHYLLLNKGYGVPVHPTSNIHINDTLANGIVKYMRSISDCYSISIINRLDRDTSGLVLVAKNAYAAENAAGTIDKTYIAICSGTISEPGRIDAPIARMGGSIIKRCVSKNGAAAVTNYTPIKTSNDLTLVSVKLETGRTHQIRVHFSYIGHPLEGDDMYGGSLDRIKRQALHCAKISFKHPILNKTLCFESPMPNDMSDIMP